MSPWSILRTIFTLGRGVLRGLPEASADRDPIELFREWYQEAEKAGLFLPEAMTVSTATPEGRPSARMILLKGVDERGFTFFTNYESRKGTGPKPPRGPDLPLGRSSTPSAGRGPGTKDLGRRVLRLLPDS